ncbi:cyclopropane fatty acid synthase and related methyltransferases [Candidatus Scalindua japonica]|uniref:Cyclopropane fatty acid synthase and related methyltransferases n=1 Tax=Candidatus Scalindua japonica TaxID=1284222 RepID=A0A286TUU6_9BACT|nr:hypothetical protein [Candidatus Scalindua japonica]GAX59662.1 cyclopropane fatty acid synthase and related methyltransferases [Candidatus Scalindua japonica]
MVSILTHKKVLTFCLILMSVNFSFHTGVSFSGEKDTSADLKFSGVDFKNGLLKVSVDKQSFKKVMNEIAKKADIQILIYFAAEEELTIGFDYLPLEKGLKRLLRGKNYAFCRSREDQQPDRLTSVMVFNREEGVSVVIKDEIMTLDQQQSLDEILQKHFLNGGNPSKQFDEALEKVIKMDIHKEVTDFKNALYQSGVEAGSKEIREISAVFDKLQKDVEETFPPLNN